MPRGEMGVGYDRLYVGSSLAAVIDGATPKADPGSSEWDLEELLSCIVTSLQEVESEMGSLHDFVSILCRQGQASGVTQYARSELPAATIGVVNADRREVWRIGDPWVVIDGNVLAPNDKHERVLAKRRSEIISAALQRGLTVDELRKHDVGRQEILGDLRELNKLRNDSSGQGFGALDGLPVPSEYLESFSLEGSNHEVALLTDGYPFAHSSLAASEHALADRIGRDPLMIDEPPATKGTMWGQRSFDDRAYLRVGLTARDSAQ